MKQLAALVRYLSVLPMAMVYRFSLVLFTLTAGALVADEAGPSKAPRLHQSGDIRIFYQTEGRHAVDRADGNHNGIPDQVEDALIQTQAARTLFVEVLGFPDPLKSERYQSARFIEIRFRDKEVLKTNGAAYDEMRGASLRFDLATSVKSAGNITPAHEFFHLIQNGATYFKNRWFTEGTARWSEKALDAGGLGPVEELKMWPLPEKEATVLFGRTYDASQSLWNPLAAKKDPAGMLPDSPALQRLQKMTYTDGSPVLKDSNLTGWKFVRDVLVELGKGDDLAFKELGYEKWSEENQKSPRNNAYILCAVEKVVGE